MPGKRTPCKVRKACDSDPAVPALRATRADRYRAARGSSGSATELGPKGARHPSLAVGIVAGAPGLRLARVGDHVTSEHGARQGLGVLIVWPAIAAVVALIAVPIAWAFRVIRAGAGGNKAPSETDPDSADRAGLAPHGREEDDLAERLRPGQDHHQPVDP